MRFHKTDGGRLDSGFRGDAGDCVTRAIAIALQLPYRRTYNELGALSSVLTGGIKTSVRDGTQNAVAHRYLINRGWSVTLTPGSYLKDLSDLTPLHYSGTFIAVLSRHYVCVIDGVVHDSWDSRISNRTKCGSPKLIGYYSRTAS